MRPFTVLIGICPGTAACSLAAVRTVLGAWAGRHPHLSSELPKLPLSLLAFTDLTAASASSFLGQAMGHF